MKDALDVEHISKRIPNTYVPARNSIFLSLAASCAEAEKASAIFIGANAVDYSGYPDCRPRYLKAFAELIRKGTKAGDEGRSIRVVAPLLRLSKKEIVRRAFMLGVPVEKTWSCYRGGKKACGRCDSCLLRAKGFRDACMKDPAL
jgi:7-cyano-7-deazaguanine synthase